jgi:TRAP-type C4-dicarboxylate transport system substrate-binding protein
MGRSKVFTIVMMLTVALSLLGVCNPAVAKTTNLNLANFFPASHFMNTTVIKQWIEEVEKVSGGTVKITSFPGQTLLKAAETYDGVVSGSADIGVSAFAYTRGRFPLMEGFELPGIEFGSCTATNVVAWEGYKHFNPKELSDTKVLWFYSVGPGILFTKSEVKTMADLKGMRIRATGLTAKSIQALGAIPVAMPMPDVYEALSKGVVEGNVAPPEVLKGWKQADVTRFIAVVPPVYNGVHYCVMNLKKWNSLPENVRTAIDAVNEKFIVTVGQIWDSEMKANGIDYGLAQGMKIGRWSKEDYDKAMDLMKPILEDYSSRMDEKGLPGKEILEFVEQDAAKYSKQYPSAY